MRKAFRYRIYPTRKQAAIMVHVIDECRWLYNHLLEQRKTTWEERQESISLYDQQTTLPFLKHNRPTLNDVHSQVLQNVAIRIDLAFKAFFRRLKSGEKPGYPRFRGQYRYDSFCYPQSGFAITDNGIRLSKIGVVKVKLHRSVEGTIKTCCIRLTSSGKWYVTFSCECELEPLPESTERVGIDVGLTQFATLSTGEQIANPRFFRKEEKSLAKVQCRLSKEEKGTRLGEKRRKVVARTHERIANRRKNFAHQESRKIVNRFGFIAVEDIIVNRMVHNRCLSKSIMDAAWAEFLGYLTYKAEWAGRQLVRVNPAYTSQMCSQCGHRQKISLSERIFACPCCQFVCDRDHNASLNIYALGLQSIGQSEEAPGFIRGE